MSKKGSILCTSLLLSSAMAFADTDMQSNGTSTNTNGQNATTSPPSTDTSTPSSTDTSTPSSTDTNASPASTPSTDTSAPGATPSSNEQGASNTNINESSSNVNATNVDVNANVTEVNNKVSITGVTTAPTFTNVESRNDVYYLPATVTPVGGFYFLNIDSTERVCSLEKITKVNVLSTPKTVAVMVNDQKHTLYCYERHYFNF
ncbi:hypothetical protein [Legionella parisiensis]|uniref:Uncharacterized protein n=1 Tax=Legionella parisiensis TaxID=45071 RepID=A0A1E5JWS2_9GAMM|nr:hypothetical protein [Legionella parisiensis]KTD44368.1 hypothetical protein Lpar_0454 [Legionella parisiensis]OEH48976.1 hypothetical protein lpari_00028 [Legionella parisiensis]STX71994.1 Uncharacterised protein [Legionella parisiensis]